MKTALNLASITRFKDIRKRLLGFPLSECACVCDHQRLLQLIFSYNYRLLCQKTGICQLTG